MRVFRVAHESSTREVAGHPFPCGPYAAGQRFERGVPDDLLTMWWDHNDDWHNSPKQDPTLGIEKHEVCGFSSLEALSAWFADHLPMLDRLGFRLWQYDVPSDRARVGEHGQVVFCARSAAPVRVGRLPLKTDQLALFTAGDVLPGQ